jgi:hypothetical protein
MAAQDNSVRFITSYMSGAPQLSANAGSLVAVLDAVLVDGFGLIAVSQIVVSAGVATATVASNTFGRLHVVRMEGSGTMALNGDKRVTGSLGNTFSFDATDISDGTYTTGTMTAKRAPLGWSIAKTDTNKRMYKSLNIASNGVMLRVDDTNTVNGWNMFANVAGAYRAMAHVTMAWDASSISAYSGHNSSSFWVKSNVSTGTSARPWIIVGDDRGFYINMLPDTGYQSGRLEFFGEIANPTRPNDAFATILTGFDQGYAVAYTSGSSTASAPGQGTWATGTSLFNLGLVSMEYNSGQYYCDSRMIAKSHNQLNSTYRVYFVGSMGCQYSVSNTTIFNASGYAGLPYPNAPDAGVYIAENIYVVENGAGIRGTLPGYAQCLQTRPIGGWQSVIENMPGAPGRIFITTQGNAYGGGSSSTINTVVYNGEVWLDILGPWTR